MHIHALDVGRAPAVPARTQAESLEAAASFIARRTGRDDATALVSKHHLERRLGQAQHPHGPGLEPLGPRPHLPALWTLGLRQGRSLVLSKPGWGGPNTAWASLKLVFPAACKLCGENLTFVSSASRQGG